MMAPETKKNRLGLSVEAYLGGLSTLCKGCGHDAITRHIIEAFFDYGVAPHEVAKMSGIGCSSKTAGYFMSRSSGLNALHGRMPSIATGANVANRSLKVIGISGDGDTASIGLGQFCHLLRRNVSLIYVIENNGVYGLTKGQFSATADPGSKLKSGTVNPYDAIDCAVLAIELGCGFVARSFAGDGAQVVSLLKAALSHPGAALLDIISPCVAFNNHEGSTKSYPFVRKIDAPLHGLDFTSGFAEISAQYPEGAVQELKLPDGSSLNLKKLSRDYDPTDRAAALRTLEESREKGELVTGLLYYDAGKKDFNATENLTDTPLCRLAEKELRPSPDALRRIMERYG
ncbi:MAG: 2-oxoacid:ferredoxin oxidoreductase subunit beta [Elusimicrobia bacterium]|nr:2-oxoacid:ferredoxin oxidoreductase subunit beta [Elusimicrobiota bacterium]